MPLQLVTAPYAEPIDRAEAIDHSKALDDGTDDALFDLFISSARRHAEIATQRQILAARWKLVLDSFPLPAGPMGVPYGWVSVPYGQQFSLPRHAILLSPTPVVQVVSIQYLDLAGVLQTMPTTDYIVDTACAPARITPAFNKTWPVNLPQIGSVQVTFDAGYVAPITADPTANTITIAGGLWKTLAINDVVRLSNSGGILPTGLAANVDYYIESVPTAGSYKLKATLAGAAIDITDAGEGTHFLGIVPSGIKSWMLLRINSLFENRGEYAVGQGVGVDPLPFVDSLLDPYRVVTF